MSQEALWKLFKFMLEASATTGKLFFYTLLFALPLGLILSLGRMSRIHVLSYPIRLYLLVMRGTPLILQLYFFYFGLPHLFGIRLDRFTAAVVSMSLNYAAYFAEIYRSGIQSMPNGQYEAAEVLGFSKRQTFFKIILPQVMKRILPPMGNEFMTLVKDTALVTAIGVAEIYQLATDSMSRLGSITPLVMAGGFYLVMNSIVSRFIHVTEKKLSYYQ